jgi:hypothetical protein
MRFFFPSWHEMHRGTGMIGLDSSRRARDATKASVLHHVSDAPPGVGVCRRYNSTPTSGQRRAMM